MGPGTDAESAARVPAQRTPHRTAARLSPFPYRADGIVPSAGSQKSGHSNSRKGRKSSTDPPLRTRFTHCVSFSQGGHTYPRLSNPCSSQAVRVPLSNPPPVTRCYADWRPPVKRPFPDCQMT